MGRRRGRKNHLCWCPETVMISTCSHSCCVYYWLREMSANTGCYYCACTLDSFVTMLNFFAIGLSLSHTPHPRHLLWQKSQLFPQFWSTLHACICRVAHEGHAGWKVWLILVGIAVIEFHSVTELETFSLHSCTPWSSAVCLAHVIPYKCEKSSCNLLIGRKCLHVYSSVVKFSIFKGTEVFSFLGFDRTSSVILRMICWIYKTWSKFKIRFGSVCNAPN
jgi:hypothetical protein